MKPDDFIETYQAALKTQDWKNIEPLFHEKVCVTFLNGAVHKGKSKVDGIFDFGDSVWQFIF